MTLIFYSTQGCHLCEQAFALLNEIELSCSFTVVDIAFDDVLFLRYGVTIPVISFQHENGLVIDSIAWPFDLQKLKTWLSIHGIN